jgi:hypothetical protein
MLIETDQSVVTFSERPGTVLIGEHHHPIDFSVRYVVREESLIVADWLSRRVMEFAVQSTHWHRQYVLSRARNWSLLACGSTTGIEFSLASWRRGA